MSGKPDVDDPLDGDEPKLPNTQPLYIRADREVVEALTAMAGMTGWTLARAANVACRAGLGMRPRTPIETMALKTIRKATQAIEPVDPEEEDS